MLSCGYETQSLLILAGLSKPTYFFEAEKCLLSFCSVRRVKRTVSTELRIKLSLQTQNEKDV